MKKATEGKSGREFFTAQRAEQATIEKACQTADTLRCEVVSLYRGGVYDLYKYQRYQDVRLVFAPEFAIAFFGGDPDNFMFPRYDLDVAFVRVYEDGKPARLKNWLRWSAAGAKDGELTFVSGNPGGTNRMLTVAQLEYQRDTALPERLVALAELPRPAHRVREPRRAEARLQRHALLRRERPQGADRPARGAAGQGLLRVEGEGRGHFAEGARRPIRKNEPVVPAFDAIAEGRGPQEGARAGSIEFTTGRAAGGEPLSWPASWSAAPPSAPSPTKRLREFSDARAAAADDQGLFSALSIYDEFEIVRAHLLLHQAAREARRRRSVREEGAGPEVAGRAGRGAGQGHQARRRGGPQDSSWRADGRGRRAAATTHDRLRPRHRPRRPRRPQALRGRRSRRCW